MNILPCPFCGDSAEIERISILKSDAVIVKCRKCKVHTLPVFYGTQYIRYHGEPDKRFTLEEAEAEAVKIWNLRKFEGERNMKDLQLIKSESFGEIQADIYSNGDDMFMTARQLYECLEESKGTFDSRLSRNPYLKSSEFSVTCKLQAADSKQYNTRVFTEDGIYEITMLSESDKAKEFRAWIRKLLKSLRTGKTKLVGTEYQRLNAEARAKNAQVRKAREYLRLAEKYNGQSFAQILDSYATVELSGEHLIPLPKLEAKTYSATEIGERLGITPNMVGILANRHNLKTEEYGVQVLDKAKGHNKEVPNFRYYESVIPVLEAILKQQSA